MGQSFDLRLDRAQENRRLNRNFASIRLRQTGPLSFLLGFSKVASVERAPKAPVFLREMKYILYIGLLNSSWTQDMQRHVI